MRATAALLLVLGSPVAHAWHPGPQVPVTAADLGVTFDDAGALRATDGDRVATARAGDAAIVEQAPWGESVLRTAGPVGGLALGPRSWAWTVPTLGLVEDVTRRRLEVGASPGLLASGDVDGDGATDLVVVHPGRIGLLPKGDGPEQTFEVAGTVTGVVVVDADRNGCGDLVLRRDDGTVTALLGACGEAPVVVAAEPVTSGTPERPAVVVGNDAPVVMSTRVGDLLSAQLVDPQGRTHTWSRRGGPNGFFVNSAGIVSYLPQPEDVGAWSIRLRLESEITLVRTADLTLIVERAASEPAPAATPEPAVADGGFQAPASGFRPPPTDAPVTSNRRGPRSDRFFSVQSCSMSLGFVGGGSADMVPTWERLGEPLFLSASPSIGVTCGGGKGRWGWFAGADTAPIYTFVLAEDVRGLHILAGVAGLAYQREKWSIGGYATAGILLAGVGGRITWLPFETRKGKRHGFEARLTLLSSEVPSAEAMLAYTFRMGGF